MSICLCLYLTISFHFLRNDCNLVDVIKKGGGGVLIMELKKHVFITGVPKYKLMSFVNN